MVGSYTAKDAIKDIVDKELFQPECEDMEFFEMLQIERQEDTDKSAPETKNEGGSLLEIFRSRISREYQEYEEKQNDPGRKAGQTEAYHMHSIYEYLHNGLSPDEVEYLAKDEHPLHSVYGYWESLSMKDECSYETTVRTMIQDDYLNINTSDKVVFFRKAGEISAIMNQNEELAEDEDHYTIRNIVEVSPLLFGMFSNNMNYHFGFITENRETQITEKGFDCIMLRSTQGKEAILITAEGYDYARYAAYIPDYSKLDLEDIPCRLYEPENEIVDLKRLVSSNIEKVSLADQQKMLCRIGELLEKTGSQDSGLYLQNKANGCFAGFLGEPVEAQNVNGTLLHIGDVLHTVDMDGNPTKTVVWQFRPGDITPDDFYIRTYSAFLCSPWNTSLDQFARMNFAVHSCRDDYDMSKGFSDRAAVKSKHPRDNSR